jgi:hypothetical protein
MQVLEGAQVPEQVQVSEMMEWVTEHVTERRRVRQLGGAGVPLTIWNKFDLLYGVLLPRVVKERLFRFFPEVQTDSISLNSALL